MIIDTRQLANIPARLHLVFVHFLELADGQAIDAEGHAIVSCSMQEMARQIGKTPRAFRRNVRELERAKVIIRKSFPGRMNRYKVLVRRPATPVGTSDTL